MSAIPANSIPANSIPANTALARPAQRMIVECTVAEGRLRA
jgi:hypothetical protein